LSDEIDPVRWKRTRRSFWSYWAWLSSVLICAERCRPRSRLIVNKLRRRPLHRWAWLSRIFLRCVGAEQIRF